MAKLVPHAMLTSGLLVYGSFNYGTSILALLTGYVVWLFLEYAFHRYAFHNSKLSPQTRRRLAYDHTEHHRNPANKEDLFLPLALTLPVSLFLFAIALVIFGFNFAAFFYNGLLAGYFIYEFLHYQAHHGKLNVGIFRWMRLYHLSHHRKKNRRYAVSNPVLDLIFRTW